MRGRLSLTDSEFSSRHDARATLCSTLYPPPLHLATRHPLMSSASRPLLRAAVILRSLHPLPIVTPAFRLHSRPLSVLSSLRSALSPAPTSSTSSTMTDASPAHAGFQLHPSTPRGSKPIQLYSLATPNGQKVGIMLEELGLPYDAHLVDISKDDQFTEWFKAINPNSKIPALVDLEGPDGKPIAVFESAAIMIYLAEKTGKFLPRHGAHRYEVLQWLEWQMGGVGPMFGQVNHFYQYAPEQVPYAKKRYLTEAKRLCTVLDTQLTKHQYVAGAEYSIADMAIYGWVNGFLKMRKGDLEGAEYPHIQRWLEELGDRPAVRNGVKVTAKQPAA